jgi:hypothetical protein
MREVDEALRQDELRTLWQRYGRAAIVGLVVLLVAIAGLLYWQHRQASAAEATGERFDAALDALAASQPEKADAELKAIAESGPEGYRAMARFTQADILLQKNDLPGAAALFKQIAEDTSLEQPFRDLAVVRQTSAEYDTLQPQMVVSRLSGLANEGSAFFGSAGEMVAVAYLRMNRRDQAGKMFAAIARSETVPQSIRQRAIQMAGVLGVDVAVERTDKTNG